jgi:acetylornithine deacetylase/succinyl-diaminopimelate desuccinylase-like protein
VTEGHGRYSRREMLQLGGRAVRLAAVGTLVAGCADTVTRPAPVPAVDPANLDPLKLTVDMIRFDTSHNGEGGVTVPYAEMLKSVWDAAGAQTEIIPTPKSDNAHFIARVPSAVRGARPLLLLCHSDVVSVEAGRWSVDPYRGEVRDGWVYGRGALDMKGTNAAFMAALLRHLKEGARFDRDIIFLSDCDEEAGPHGTRWLAEQHYDKIDAGAVITEGGWALAPPGSVEPVVITLTRQDKISAALELVAQGTTTHSSRPSPDAAITRLNRAAVHLADYQPGVGLTEVTRAYFEAWASRTDNPKLAAALRLMLNATGQAERDRAGALVVQLSGHPTLHNALMRHIVTPVIQRAGYRINVQPGSATATLNLRLVPGGIDVAATVAEIRNALGASDGVTVRLMNPLSPDQTEEQVLTKLAPQMTQPPGTIDTDVFRALDAAAHETYPGAAVTPGLFEAGTSAGPWRQRGIPVYGIYPYAVDDDTMSRMHGNDERIRVDALARGTELMYRVFTRFHTS